MTKTIYAIEELNARIGQTFGWCVIVLILSAVYEIFIRYVFDAPTVWAYDIMMQMYGALFLMAGPYALTKDSHVRFDVFYRSLSVGNQARLDLFLYITFFLPGMLSLVWFGWEISIDSWRHQEISWNSPARIQVYYFKTLIPIAGGLFIIQGIAECMRCYIAIKTNEWLPRLRCPLETKKNLQIQAAILVDQ